MKLPEKNLKDCTSHQFFKYFPPHPQEELLAKIAKETNLYRSKINPNKPMNCTVYGTQKLMEFVLLVL